LDGVQLGHFVTASWIRSTYLRCAVSFERNGDIVGVVSQ
jgi:hypothetical protein